MLNKSELSSLEFVVSRLFAKLLRTNNIETVDFVKISLDMMSPEYYGREMSLFDSNFFTSENAFHD